MFTILPTDVDYMLMGATPEPERSRNHLQLPCR